MTKSSRTRSTQTHYWRRRVLYRVFAVPHVVWNWKIRPRWKRSSLGSKFWVRLMVRSISPVAPLHPVAIALRIVGLTHTARSHQGVCDGVADAWRRRLRGRPWSRVYGPRAQRGDHEAVATIKGISASGTGVLPHRVFCPIHRGPTCHVGGLAAYQRE